MKSEVVEESEIVSREKRIFAELPIPDSGESEKLKN